MTWRLFLMTPGSQGLKPLWPICTFFDPQRGVFPHPCLCCTDSKSLPLCLRPDRWGLDAPGWRVLSAVTRDPG